MQIKKFEFDDHHTPVCRTFMALRTTFERSSWLILNLSRTRPTKAQSFIFKHWYEKDFNRDKDRTRFVTSLSKDSWSVSMSSKVKSSVRKQIIQELRLVISPTINYHIRSRLVSFYSCGYVLMPECVRQEDFDPYDREQANTEPWTLTIKVLVHCDFFL